MPDRPGSALRLDLSTYSEATRRALYDLIVKEHFSSTDADLEEEETPVERRSAEEAGLAVYWVLGRWIAVWAVADVPEDAPEAERWEVLRITLQEDGSIRFLEC